MGDVAERATLGRMQNPVRGFLHGTAAGVSIVGAVNLWAQAGESSHQVGFLIFALSLVCLFTTSSLYHSVPWEQDWKNRMQRIDHSMIYLVVAGTYTPLAWALLDGWWCTVALSAAWSIAALGILQKIFFPKVDYLFSVILQNVQGWLAFPLLWPLGQQLPTNALLLTILGGAFYTVGVVCLVSERPRLWPRVFSYHELFHILVIAGSTSHYIVMYSYLARFGTGSIV